MRKSHLVAVLLYPPSSTFDVGCAAEVFAGSVARQEGMYRLVAGSMNPGPVPGAGGIDLHANHGLEIFEIADTIIIPSWDPERTAPPELLNSLRTGYQKGSRLLAVGSGAFLLAAAGLLDGKKVATHWSKTEALIAAHPRLRAEPDMLYVDEGQIVTGAGSAAALDMFLHVVALDYGVRASNLVASHLVAPPHRSGDVAQRRTRPMPRSADTQFHKVLEYLRRNACESHRPEALAAMAGMSPTTFNRRFRSAVGRSPHEWLIRERVAMARELLEASDLSIDRVSVEAGFGSTQSFRAAFARLVGATPANYRRGFHSRFQPSHARARSAADRAGFNQALNS